MAVPLFFCPCCCHGSSVLILLINRNCSLSLAQASALFLSVSALGFISQHDPLTKPHPDLHGFAERAWISTINEMREGLVVRH